MTNYKMHLQYDGSTFDGWQKQKNTDRTIQAKLEKVLSDLAGVPIEVQGAGRTDAGVHAYDQVANFHFPEKPDPLFLRDYLNRYLPERIGILRVEETASSFHSRLSAVGKEYLYRIRNSTLPNVFQRGYQYVCPDFLDLTRMREAAGYLVGTHDYASFCSHAGKKKSTVRTIHRISIETENEEILLYYHGNGFLHNMVRILTGTLVEVGKGLRSPDSMPELLQKKDRRDAGFTAPPHGLFLYKVYY